MALALGYAVAAVLALYLLDYSVYGRMMNITSIARLSSKREVPDSSYKPSTASRLVCSAIVATTTFSATIATGMLQTISIVGAVVTASMMVLITLGTTT